MSTERAALQQAFFGNLKDAGSELLQVCVKYDLNQAQAACAAAWALNQMSSVEGRFPKVATMYLDHAVQDKGPEEIRFMKKLFVNATCLLALCAGTALAAETQSAPYALLSSRFATLALPFEKLDGRAVRTDESGYVLLVLSPYEHAVFSQGKLVRYMCLDGSDERTCRATTTPRATPQYSFTIAEGENAQSLNLRILDADHFKAHSDSPNPQGPYTITHVDGQGYGFSYDKEKQTFVIKNSN